jgi:hypothetical protein
MEGREYGRSETAFGQEIHVVGAETLRSASATTNIKTGEGVTNGFKKNMGGERGPARLPLDGQTDVMTTSC